MRQVICKAGWVVLLLTIGSAARADTTEPPAAMPTVVASTPGPSLAPVRAVCANEIRASRFLGNKGDGDFDADLAELYDSLRAPARTGAPAGIRADPTAFSKDEDGRASYLLVSCLIFLVDSQRIGTDLTRIALTWPDIRDELLQGFGPIIATPAAATGAAECEQAVATQEAEFADIDRRNPARQPGVAPDTLPVLPGLQVALYMTSQRLLLLDTQCKGQVRYSEYPAVRRQYDNAERACREFTGNTRDCQARVAW
jgi:hypothetical protein